MKCCLPRLIQALMMSKCGHRVLGCHGVKPLTVMVGLDQPRCRKLENFPRYLSAPFQLPFHPIPGPAPLQLAGRCMVSGGFIESSACSPNIHKLNETGVAHSEFRGRFYSRGMYSVCLPARVFPGIEGRQRINDGRATATIR